MVLLAAWCGLRFGELAELRRSDVDLKDGVLHIRRAVVRVDGEVIVGTPKTDAGIRDVAIPPHLLPAVKEHLQQHAEPGRDGLLFPAADGGHLAPSTLYKVVLPGTRGRWPATTCGCTTSATPAPSWPLDGRHARRADGPARALHTRRGAALPARRRGPRHGDCKSA